MNSLALASIRLSDVLSPKGEGEPVNVHVVEPVREPEPDFSAMQRLISGADAIDPLRKRAGTD